MIMNTIEYNRMHQIHKSSTPNIGDLLTGFGNLAGPFGLLDTLDDAHCDSLTHVTDSETAKGRVIGESFNTRRFGGDHLYDSSVTSLDKFGEVFDPKTFSIFHRSMGNYFLPERRSIFSNSSANLQAI